MAILPLAILTLTVTGCGGFATSGAVSPLQFLLPGLIQNQPKTVPKTPVAPVPATQPVTELAQSH